MVIGGDGSAIQSISAYLIATVSLSHYSSANL